MISGSCHCGKVQWQAGEVPSSATACSCTACRRYGALWAYGREGDVVRVSGPTATYTKGRWVKFHFCPECACMVYWRSLRPHKDGVHEMGFNLRMSEPEDVAGVPIIRHDGLNSPDDLPPDGRCVADYWF
jgi:hypothetical protein